MSARILSRSRWTSTAAGGRPVTWSQIRGLVCHYPGMGGPAGVLSEAREAALIRGWRNYHVGALRWSDLGYNYVIGQSGRIYTGRGDRVGAHAVGHNSTTLGVLFIVGDNEALTPAAKAAFRALRAALRKRGAGAGVWGHTEMSGNSTRCPGPYIMGSIRDGSLKGSVPSVPSGGASAPVPSKPASKPAAKPSTGKLKVDGRWGQATTRALQKRLGVSQDGRAGIGTFKALQRLLGAPYVDGQISRQSYKATELGNGIVPSAWGYTGRGSKGSQTVVLLQKRLGVTADGVVGAGTVKALQKALNDGKLEVAVTKED